VKYELQGTTMQVLNLQVEPGETVVAESGRMIYMTDNIKMETEATGGIWAGIKRAFAGESFFLVNFSSQAGTGLLAMGSEIPGKIIPLQLAEGQEIIAQKDAFLCCEKSVTFDAAFTKKIGAGFLGGEGLVLLKVRGPGLVFFNVGGEVTKLKLEAGQKIRVDTGCLAMFDGGMEYDVERIKGIKNMIFGGENFFLATVKGPGNAWIQSLPVQELALKLYSFMPHPRGRDSAGAVLAGAALGSMFGRR